MMSSLAARAVIIDQIAVVVGSAIIKDSDIERDIRVVSFLNREKLSFDVSTRRAAANRLIDQSLIQREIDVGEYQVPPESDADKLLRDTERDRAPSPQAFSRLLAGYGLSVEQLRAYLYWQLTVLRFIDQRFRPAVLVTDDDVQNYYREHSAEFSKTHSGQPESLDDARSEIRETITNERINQQFDGWIRSRRKSTNIQFLEESLK
ncbi:MAG: hypothetical protein WB676_32915 [Bryobacteraceae bacterium]